MSADEEEETEEEVECDPELAALIAKRLAEIESGEARTIPWAEAKKRLFGE